MMTDAVALAKERSAAKTAGFWYKFKIGVAVFLKYFSLIFVAFMMLLPLVSCFVTAAKTDKEYQSTSVMDMPKNWFNFDNYVQAFVASNMAVAFRNSIIVVVVVLVVTTIIGTMLAYVLSRFQFPGNGLIRGMFALAALLPGIAMQVALYKMMVNFHAVNTMWGYIVMMCGTDVISIYVFIQFFENISTSLDEAAIMDGASYFTVYYKILLPLLKPAIVTCAILKGVGVYNEYYAANLYLQDANLKTIAIALYSSPPDGQQVQPDLRRRDHHAAADADPVPDLPEADLQRHRSRLREGIKNVTSNFLFPQPRAAPRFISRCGPFLSRIFVRRIHHVSHPQHVCSSERGLDVDRRQPGSRSRGTARDARRGHSGHCAGRGHA